mgnify:CR=1 FL=1
MSYLAPVNKYDLTKAMIEKSQAATLVGTFGELLSQLNTSHATNIDPYLSQLQSKFGSKIAIQDLAYNKANIDYIGSTTIGTGNVIIAPNILEKMATDSEARRYYEQKIQGHFDTIPTANAFMAVRGRQIVSSGVIIHPDGKVTYYSRSDYTPEEKARLEKAMKEEDETKAKKRAEEKRLDEIARNKYWEYWSQIVSKPGLAGTIYSNVPYIYGVPVGLGQSQRIC